jgi:hypothetical protein
MLAPGTKLFAPDKGFGEKHGVVVSTHPIGEYVIKWEEFDEPLLYSPGDNVEGKVQNGIFVVVEEGNGKAGNAGL